jgi:drug/metabolite transporter (DMT)-like permease
VTTVKDSPPRAGTGVVAMTLATMIWGATFVVIRDVLHGIGPVELIATRFTAASVLFGVALAVRRRPIGSAALRAGLLAGLCAAVGFLCQAIGLTSTSAGNSAFLTCTGTVFAAFFAWPLLRQRPSSTLLQGIALALAGSALLSTRLGLPSAGDAWTLLGALAFALQIVALARTAGHVDTLELVAFQSLTVALVLLPFARHAPQQLAALDTPGLARVAYLVIPGTVVAPLLQVIAQRVLPAGRVALLFALEPVFALVFALAFGGERFAPRWWLGAALILSGVVRVEWMEARSEAGAPTPATR